MTDGIPMTDLFRVKICGITNVADGRAAVAAGADAIGLNFYAGSPRCVTGDTAREILTAIGSGTLKIAVFVNEPPERIIALRNEVGFDVAQLHGDETPDAIAALAGVPV